MTENAPWWLLDRYAKYPDPARLRKVDMANFPQGILPAEREDLMPRFLELGESDDESGLKQRAAANLLAAHFSGTCGDLRDLLEKAAWLAQTCPLPLREPFDGWDKAWWEWLLEETVVCPVFCPTVVLGPFKEVYLIRFDVVVLPPSGWKDGISIADAEPYHSDSICAARQALPLLEPNMPDFRVFADDRSGNGQYYDSTGRSASLGIALAVWAGAMRRLHANHPAWERVALDYMVTGDVSPDPKRRIQPVDGIKEKLAACDIRKHSLLLGPSVHGPPNPKYVTAGAWKDTLNRLAPHLHYTEKMPNPPVCDILVLTVSRQTLPIVLAICQARPAQMVVLLHSANAHESKGPAERIKKLFHETPEFRAPPIELAMMDSQRLDIAEQDFRKAVYPKEKRSTHVLVNITGGNKIMATAASSMSRGRYRMVYRERFGDEYTVIEWEDTSTAKPRPAPFQFFEESRGILQDFDPLGLIRCYDDRMQFEENTSAAFTLADKRVSGDLRRLIQKAKELGANPRESISLRNPEIRVDCVFALSGPHLGGIWYVFAGERINQDIKRIEELALKTGLGSRVLFISKGPASPDLADWCKQRPVGRLYFADSTSFQSFCENDFAAPLNTS